LRIPGVLQRFAISYFVVALTELLTAELYSWKKGETVLVNENIIPKFNNAQCKHPSTCNDALNLQK